MLAGDSNNAAAWRDLGNALSGLKRHEEAIAVYDRAIALAPDNAANWRDCGMAMVAIGQREEALTYIDKALARGIAASMVLAPDQGHEILNSPVVLGRVVASARN